MTDQEVYLGLDVVVQIDVPYKERAKRLVDNAKKFERDKTIISPKGLESLIGAGAQIKSLNISQGRSYYSKVIIEGINFIAFSEKPIIYEISEALR
jgi:hypothetical protein